MGTGTGWRSAPCLLPPGPRPSPHIRIHIFRNGGLCGSRFLSTGSPLTLWVPFLQQTPPAHHRGATHQPRPARKWHQCALFGRGSSDGPRFPLLVCSGAAGARLPPGHESVRPIPCSSRDGCPPPPPTLLRSWSFSSRHTENCRFHCSALAADSCSAVLSRALLSRRVCSSISHFFTLAALGARAGGDPGGHGHRLPRRAPSTTPGAARTKCLEGPVLTWHLAGCLLREALSRRHGPPP